MSVAERVAQGVAQLAEGVDWGSGVTPLVVVRDRPEVAEQDGCSATTPTVVVVARRGRTELVWAGKVMQTYTVGLAVAVPSPQVLGNTGQMNDWVEGLRQAVHTAGDVPGVPETNEVRPGDQLPFDPATLDRNFRWGVLAFDVECLENRSA